MKVVLLEVPEHHKHPMGNGSRSVYEYIETWVKVAGGESELVQNLVEADSRLT